MIRRNLIVIGLSPACLRVATLAGGEVANVSCTPLEPGEWDQAWAKGLTSLDAPLRAALDGLGVRAGTIARVVYTGPKASAEVFNVPADGPAALKASEFSLRETLGDKNAAWPVTVHVMHRDEGQEGDEQGRSHVLAVGDSVAGSNMVAAWLMRAGLGIDGLIPAKAAAIVAAVRAATALPQTGTYAVLWMGEQVTALAGWSTGRLVFARAIEFGYSLMADGVYRGARSQGLTTFGRLDSNRLLFAAGVPKRGDVLDAARGVTAEHVLPLLQPILQRYVIETRQTLRFGIPESELARTTLLLGGPGAGIFGITSTIESQFDVAVERLDKNQPRDASAMEQGELSDILNANTGAFTLLPPAESERRISARLSAALRMGTVAAALCLAALAGWTYARTANISRDISRLEARAEAMQQHDLLRDQADRLAVDLSGATRTIRETLGDRPRWMAGLALVSRACGESITLNHLAGAYPAEAGGAPVMTLSGTASPGRDPSVKADCLVAFLDRLVASPIVLSAKIVSTRADANGGEAKSFVISVQLKAMTPEAALVAVCAQQAGAQQPSGRGTAQVQESAP